jgi:hypothetical protein
MGDYPNKMDYQQADERKKTEYAEQDVKRTGVGGMTIQHAVGADYVGHW